MLTRSTLLSAVATGNYFSWISSSILYFIIQLSMILILYSGIILVFSSGELESKKDSKERQEVAENHRGIIFALWLVKSSMVGLILFVIVIMITPKFIDLLWFDKIAEHVTYEKIFKWVENKSIRRLSQNSDRENYKVLINMIEESIGSNGEVKINKIEEESSITHYLEIKLNKSQANTRDYNILEMVVFKILRYLDGSSIMKFLIFLSTLPYIVALWITLLMLSPILITCWDSSRITMLLSRISIFIKSLKKRIKNDK